MPACFSTNARAAVGRCGRSRATAAYSALTGLYPAPPFNRETQGRDKLPPLEGRMGGAMLPMMFRLALIRLRAVMLLLAFSLSLAGQAVAGMTMAGPMSPAPGEPVVVMSGAAMGGCSDCDGGKAAISPTCPVAFCWDFVALPAPTAPHERIASVGFAPARYDASPGIRLRPDPYPPRTLLPA
jgi:hypothetical protein